MSARQRSNNKSEAVWRPFSLRVHRDIPGPQLSWLLDPASLTQRLIATCPGCFQVEVVDERWAKPFRSERKALGIRRNTLARVRQVRLLCDGVPWVFARTVIPYSTLKGPVRRLSMLGTRPLGAVLFADPTMQRGRLEIAGIRSGDYLYQRATRELRKKAKIIWGRRSVFYLSGKPLLVNEIFLPGIDGKT